VREKDDGYQQLVPFQRSDSIDPDPNIQLCQTNRGGRRLTLYLAANSASTSTSSVTRLFHPVDVIPHTHPANREGETRKIRRRSVCQLDFDCIPFSIRSEYAQDMRWDRNRKKKPEANPRDSLDVGLLGDLLQGRGKYFARAAPAVPLFPTSEMRRELRKRR
jgi:hypothetical protein